MSSLLVTMLLATGGCTDSAADVLATCDGGNLDACYRDGLAALEAARPQYSEARKRLAQACTPTYSGDMQRQVKNGGFSWRPRASMGTHKENHSQACFSLGLLVRDAKGGPRDLPRAAELFELACKGDVREACLDLGLVVYDPPADSDLDAEPERAVELFFDACNEVNPTGDAGEAPHPMARACEALGRAYADGKGVEKGRPDNDRATELFVKACDAKFAKGCVSAGKLNAKRGGRTNLQKAAELFDRGCLIDARHGCYDLAKLHERKAYPDASIEQAADYYKKSCAIDPTHGCFEAAALMETGQVEARDGEIEALYNQACEHGHTEACSKRKIP